MSLNYAGVLVLSLLLFLVVIVLLLLQGVLSNTSFNNITESNSPLIKLSVIILSSFNLLICNKFVDDGLGDALLKCCDDDEFLFSLIGEMGKVLFDCGEFIFTSMVCGCDFDVCCDCLLLICPEFPMFKINSSPESDSDSLFEFEFDIEKEEDDDMDDEEDLDDPEEEEDIEDLKDNIDEVIDSGGIILGK